MGIIYQWRAFKNTHKYTNALHTVHHKRIIYYINLIMYDLSFLPSFFFFPFALHMLTTALFPYGYRSFIFSFFIVLVWYRPRASLCVRLTSHWTFPLWCMTLLWLKITRMLLISFTWFFSPSKNKPPLKRGKIEYSLSHEKQKRGMHRY